MKPAAKGAALIGALLLAGCVSMPSGPAVMVLPGTGKNFDQFRADDMDCRQFAYAQVGGTSPDAAAGDSMVRSAALGTLIGAAAGAIAGGSSNVAAGAASGLFFGSAMGAAAGSGSQYSLQQRYDISYTQCMYTKGHQVPAAGYSAAPRRSPAAGYYPAPTTASSPPPPPPPSGTPPPPPPGVN